VFRGRGGHAQGELQPLCSERRVAVCLPGVHFADSLGLLPSSHSFHIAVLPLVRVYPASSSMPAPLPSPFCWLTRFWPAPGARAWDKAV